MFLGVSTPLSAKSEDPIVPAAPRGNFLDCVRIRLIEEHERLGFDLLLETKHYLQSSHLGGRHLRYVAEVDGKWVALITFSGAAPFIKVRDRQKLKWTDLQRARRLGLVVNNSRFLVLEDRHRHPNLGSKVLSLALKHLPLDWEKRWGYRPLVVESFVDESLYHGTCYRACGFENLGATAGFKRHAGDYYTQHGKPKGYYLRELRSGACALLRRPRLPECYAKAEAQIAAPCPFGAPCLESLFQSFRQLRDQRRGHGLRHRMASTMACAAVATLMGADSYQAFEDMTKKLSQPQLRALRCPFDREQKRYLPPSDSTFYRVLNLVEPEAFERIIAGWLIQQEPAQLERLALDGKVLRGTAVHEKHKPMMLLSVVTHSLKTTLATLQIEEKSNEIPAAPLLLQGLNLAGSLITADAMHCQKKTARYITQELGADYLFGLKGNQSGILELAEIKLSPVFFPSGYPAHGQQGRPQIGQPTD